MFVLITVEFIYSIISSYVLTLAIADRFLKLLIIHKRKVYYKDYSYWLAADNIQSSTKYKFCGAHSILLLHVLLHNTKFYA